MTLFYLCVIAQLDFALIIRAVFFCMFFTYLTILSLALVKYIADCFFAWCQGDLSKKFNRFTRIAVERLAWAHLFLIMTLFSKVVYLNVSGCGVHDT